MAYSDRLVFPEGAKRIERTASGLSVPNYPLVFYFEGDGIGVDVVPTMIDVVDAAVKQAYQGERRLGWTEVYAGGKALEQYGENQYLPEETLDAVREIGVGIKGPLMTPIGGGIRSLNVALRQKLDLYVCLRPIKYLSLIHI